MLCLLLGETGAGKSTFIDKAGPQLHRRPKIGHDLGSCTTSVAEFKIQNPKNPKSCVVLVDTPGFNDSDPLKGDDEQLKAIIDWLKGKSQPDAKIAGVIYLHDISQARVIQCPTVMNANLVSRPPGVLFATTKWSKHRLQQDESRERELKDAFAYVQLDRFENTVDSAWKLIDAVVSSPGWNVTLLEFQTKLEAIRPQFKREEKRKPKFFHLFMRSWAK
ncbi:hypothetical protein BDZ97DRAFT_1389876 [Flammula alnicola]|nr:hypothetical protein BDZ97DRAFT_1389876 [Flammula alnicola]